MIRPNTHLSTYIATTKTTLTHYGLLMCSSIGTSASSPRSMNFQIHTYIHVTITKAFSHLALSTYSRRFIYEKLSGSTRLTGSSIQIVFSFDKPLHKSSIEKLFSLLESLVYVSCLIYAFALIKYFMMRSSCLHR